VRSHIRELAARDYQKLHGLNSLDYVVIFVPIETAFMLAISNDVTLWEEAWEKNVLLVSPSTLLFMVRTVAHLWRQEDQSRNAKEIASRGADLYDKLVGFVEDVESVGNRLKQAGESYDRAYSKLATGNNNLIRQADKLRALGVKPTKSLTQRVLALAGSEEEQIE
jgi:DNA recombination protein RmuC